MFIVHDCVGKVVACHPGSGSVEATPLEEGSII